MCLHVKYTPRIVAIPLGILTARATISPVDSAGFGVSGAEPEVGRAFGGGAETEVCRDCDVCSASEAWSGVVVGARLEERLVDAGDVLTVKVEDVATLVGEAADGRLVLVMGSRVTPWPAHARLYTSRLAISSPQSDRFSQALWLHG